MSSQAGSKRAGLENSGEAVFEPGGTPDGDVDLSLLKDILAKTPWERMQANDDALNFAESLRTAMKQRNAKSQ